MKKLISTLIVLFMLTALCACGGSSDNEKPEKYNVGEMQFALSNDYNLTLDNESNAEKASYKENEVYANKDFSGNIFDLSVKAALTSYDNTSIDKYIDEMLDITLASNQFEDITVGDVTGKMGTYTDDSGEICVVYALKDGFFYSLEAKIKSDNKSAAEALKAICQTVTYDPALVGTQTVTCGDLTYEISKKYAALEFEEVTTSYDEQWFATADTSYMELGSLYFIDWENGYDLASMAYNLTTTLENSTQTSEEGTLGTYEYITGKDASGYNHIIAMFKYEDKSYCFNLFSKNQMTAENIKPILDSIKVNEIPTETDATEVIDMTDTIVPTDAADVVAPTDTSDSTEASTFVE